MEHSRCGSFETENINKQAYVMTGDVPWSPSGADARGRTVGAGKFYTFLKSTRLQAFF
jgi:hypothetical protein